jgi:hypothetical protein
MQGCLIPSPSSWVDLESRTYELPQTGSVAGRDGDAKEPRVKLSNKELLLTG